MGAHPGGFFPTSSSRTKQSTWIALNKVKNIKSRNKMNESQLEFNNQEKID